ncbi:testis-expressed protein 30 [Salmo trutta]|uniref:Testis expressed 30 n=1 Tax=Salmo trutta TaxID=8032 RepID=A0A673Z0W4_SALTR|nr:testis-expressed protein 30-like [Salmo trutta]XP_029568198.1 testis-expressed protein 30-like [Salmo trutta]
MGTFQEDRLNIIFGKKQIVAVRVVLSVPANASAVQTAVILTHGAGGDMNLKHLVSLAHVLASNGLLCLRFTCKGLNLVYRVKAYNAVWEHLKYLKKFTIRQVFFVGCSMGARAASALARQLSGRPEDAVAGLVCLSFPLHPPGQTHTHRQRSEDLRGLPKEVPVLFLSGTADNMCEKILLEDVVKEMKCPTTVHWIEGGNHGLTMKGRAEESVLDEVNSKVLSWILEHEADS